MCRTRILTTTGLIVSMASPVLGAETLKYGEAPQWVVPQTIPQAKPTDAPVALLLNDQQIAFDRDKVTSYSELVFKIQNPQGLAAGNLSIAWQPGQDTVTVNKVEIRRGDKVIDVLGAGQSFTILRRETNLDAAMLDGTLTANIQPEGLQEGDIVDLATTIEHSDPVMKGHAEASFAAWNGVPLQAGHALIYWPAGTKLNLRESAGLPTVQKSTRNGHNVAEISATGVEPLIAPKSAPTRYSIGRLGEASDFASWSDLAQLMLPLYRAAAVIPSSGPLRNELETIRAASKDPKVRAAQSLALVQNRIRYVALLMGQGGYVPASTEQTWSRRFGDCKAKTVLLLGLLHELGIEAEPVLVNSKLGDAVADRLPMLALFDHVLVRARIAGKSYWFDGTRTGDAAIDDIQPPDFGWVLPLVDNASLVHTLPSPLKKPDQERHVDVDATGGVFAPVPITITEIRRGDSAVQLNMLYSAVSADQRDQLMRESGKSYFNGFGISSSSLQFDKERRELTVVIKGNAKLSWDDGWLYVPTSSIAFNPDFDRPAGPLHDVPVEVSHPRFVKDVATIKLPAGFAEQQKLHSPVNETLAGVEYARTETISGNVLTVESSERSLLGEVPYKDALAVAPRLRALDKDDVYLRMADGYRPTQNDLAAKESETPSSAAEYVDRGNLRMNAWKLDGAIADFTQALTFEPTNVAALADRGLAHIWKQEFEQAEKDLSAAEARDTEDGLILRAKGLMAELKGECSKAVDFYTRSLAKEPGNNFTRGHRAICESQLSKFDDALADSEEALKADPSWIDLRVLRANIFRGAGKQNLVAVEAEAMTRESPNSDYAWVAAGKTYAALGQRDKAVEALNRALAIKSDAYIYVNRAQVRPLSDVAGRMADLDTALKLEPDNGDALAEMARLLGQRGDFKGALALLDRTKPDPDNLYLELQRAILLYRAGRIVEASTLVQSVRRAAKSANEFNSLCWLKATAGVMLDSALEDCREALRLSPGIGPYLDSLGMVLLKLGKLDEALDAYNQSIAKDTGAASLMGRAFVYLRKGDRARAETDTASARKLSKDIDETFAEYGLKFDEASGTIAAH